MKALAGVRGRVVAIVMLVSSILFSLTGAIGFIAVADSGRAAVAERINEVIDGLEANLRAGTPTSAVSTPDGVQADVMSADDAETASRAEDLVITRRVVVSGTEVVLVGVAPLDRLSETLRALHRGLWITVPLAVALTALMAGIAANRALRPVAAITTLAATIGAGNASTRVPVPSSGDEIEVLARTTNEMLERIAAGIDAQHRFTSDAAHELRTPLMAIAAEIELAQQRPSGEDPQLLPRLQALTERLADRVNDLVLLSSLDEAPRLIRQTIDLAAVIRAEADALGLAAVVVSGDGRVDANADLTARAVRNLLANGTRHGTSVRATIRPDRERVWIHVDDDGPGIPAEQREAVFARFSRLDDGRSADAGGAGLGLAIVASVADAHHGGVAAETSPLGGARVSIWFPARHPAPAPAIELCRPGADS